MSKSQSSRNKGIIFAWSRKDPDPYLRNTASWRVFLSKNNVTLCVGPDWWVPGGDDERGPRPHQLHHVPHTLRRKAPGQLQYSALLIRHLKNIALVFRNDQNLNSGLICNKKIKIVCVNRVSKRSFCTKASLGQCCGSGMIFLVHRHFISVCYVSGTKRIGIKRIAA